MLDSVTWGAFAVTFTTLGALGTWLAYRRRGLRSGLRWAAATLLVPAAYFTRTLRMFGRIADAISDWATSFVWNPLVWVGLVLAALSAGLFVVAARLPGRERLGRRDRRAQRAVPGTGAAAPTPVPAARRDVDPEIAEIEALLKRRGIS